MLRKLSWNVKSHMGGCGHTGENLAHKMVKFIKFFPLKFSCYMVYYLADPGGN